MNIFIDKHKQILISLIESKIDFLLSGRLKDKADVDELQKIMKLKKK